MTQDREQLWRASLKSADTEEWIDLLFYRPLGFRWALLFRKWGWSPNRVTVASIFLGMLAGVMFYFNSLVMNMMGVCMLVWANVYDSTDGQLARITGQKSEWGRILDGMAGTLWFMAIYTALALRMTADWSFWIWLLASLAGYSHSKQASMADYYRNAHLFFLSGKQASEHDLAKQQEAAYDGLSWRIHFWKKLFRWFYKSYTTDQERITPTFQLFFNAWQEARPGEAASASLRKSFREKSLPLMKYTNILSFNTRATVLCLSVLLGIPWLFFLFELTVLNVLLVYMVSRHEQLSWEMLQELKATTDGQEVGKP